MLLLHTACVTTIPPPTYATTPPPSTMKVQEESLHWLHLIDTGQYGKSWDMSAQAFKQSVSQDEWIEKLRVFRFPLGSLRHRSLISAKPRSALPALPDGKYNIFLYSTEFSNKESATETITCLLEQSGEWKVVGYFIR